MKKNDNKATILGAVAIAAGAALIGRIIYDFKKIRQLTKEEEDLAAVEPTDAPAEEVQAEEATAETEAPAEETAEETPAEEATAE